jgi:hypothetical protein
MLDPTRDEARRWAIEELSHGEYRRNRPGLVAQALEWLSDQVQRWLDSLPGGNPSWWALSLGLLLAATGAVIGYAVWRAGGVGRLGGARGSGSVFTDQAPRSAAEHRAAADDAEAAGDWQRAVVERFRAIARDLEERTVLTPRPGWTADEVAREAGTVLPALREPLLGAAHTFDAIRYGGRVATPEHVTRLREVDAAVRAAHPVPA